MGDIVITKNTINIKKVFQEKAPGLSKWIPGFLYKYIRKKIHEKALNAFLYANRDKVGLDFVDAGLDYIGANFEVTGIENIKPTGRFILASNHPIGGPEGLALMQIVGKIRKDFGYLSNDLLMNIPALKPLFIPVNKHGSNNEYISLFNEAFNSDKLIMIFPAGLVSRKIDGKIRDLVWKTSFITRAVKHNRDIIPVHVDGKNSNFFYNLANFRKKFNIKANLEMFQLIDEMMGQKNKTIKITIGKPIPYTCFDKRINYRQWSELVRKYIYDLKNDSELVFDKAYFNDKVSELAQNDL